MSCQGISRIYTSMLPTGTSKTHHQTFETAPDIIFHSDVNNIKHTIQVFSHLSLLFNIIHYASVTTVHSFEFFNAAGIKYTPAVKNKSTAITAFICRNSLPVRKTTNLNYQWCLFICL